MKAKIKTIKVVAAILAATLTTGVYAKGGTAKPPTKGVTITWGLGPLATPSFTPAHAAALHGFDMTGILQDATVSTDSAACPGETDPNRLGGTATINGIKITVPCNMVIQMPANTFTWAEMVNGGPSLTLANPAVPPSFELHVVGNIVDGQYRAGLMYISQQSLNSGSGVITRIDYGTGNMYVATGDATSPETMVQINDPNGRFGRAQSPDPRFSVDDENPTIHAATGYPMCVPRGAPGTFTNADGTKDDLLCPEKNRPLVLSGCRNFSQAFNNPSLAVPPITWPIFNTLPVSGDLTFLQPGPFCSQFVMKAPVGTPGIEANNIAGASDPDVMQQAPFEVGDFITWSGTLIHDPTNVTPDYISAHTVEANVGIYTQPGTGLGYVAIGEFGVGTADPALVAVNGLAQETQDRIFVEAETTDIMTPVDIFYLDIDRLNGAELNRWITPYEMTGECNPAVQPFPANCYNSSGGITTQFAGAQPQRARLRATKAPTNLLNQPPRNIRVAQRSRCPLQPSPAGSLLPYDQALLDSCLSTAPLIAANGLKVGQYSAPVFEYIFPENVKPGDATVPNDLWHLPALVNGEAANTGGVGPLTPTPW